MVAPVRYERAVGGPRSWRPSTAAAIVAEQPDAHIRTGARPAVHFLVAAPLTDRRRIGRKRERWRGRHQHGEHDHPPSESHGRETRQKLTHLVPSVTIGAEPCRALSAPVTKTRAATAHGFRARHVRERRQKERGETADRKCFHVFLLSSTFHGPSVGERPSDSPRASAAGSDSGIDSTLLLPL